jgi:glycosyltransferase involved in cell wall biosynthesis
MNGPPLLLVEALATRNDSGLGRLARLVLDGLGGVAREAEIHAILPRGGSYLPAPHIRPRYAEARPFRLWTQAAFPLLIRRLRPAAVLCLGQTLPAWRPRSRYALMIPDAGPLEDLGRPASSHDEYNRRWLRAMPRKADRILTIGSFSRDRIHALAGIPLDRISVVKPIRPPSLAPGAGEGSSGSTAAAAAAPPSHPYILSMGNVEPRKNHAGLIAAYARFRVRHPDAPELCIVGHKAWGYPAAAAAARAHGVEDRVRFAGFVPEASREAWIGGCAFYVSSSLYEGWGLPLFEALAAGKPSIYHRGSSQDEFARGMALAVDCADPDRLAEAMGRLWTDAGERFRLTAALAEGFRRVQEYDLEGALRDALLPLLRPA